MSVCLSGILPELYRHSELWGDGWQDSILALHAKHRDRPAQVQYLLHRGGVFVASPPEDLHPHGVWGHLHLHEQPHHLPRLHPSRGRPGCRTHLSPSAYGSILSDTHITLMSSQTTPTELNWASMFHSHRPKDTEPTIYERPDSSTYLPSVRQMWLCSITNTDQKILISLSTETASIILQTLATQHWLPGE